MTYISAAGVYVVRADAVQLHPGYDGAAYAFGLRKAYYTAGGRHDIMSAWAEKAVNHPSGFAVELNIVNDLVAVVFGLRTWVYGRDGDGAAAYAQKGVLDSFLFIAELLVIFHMKK